MNSPCSAGGLQCASAIASIPAALFTPDTSEPGDILDSFGLNAADDVRINARQYPIPDALPADAPTGAGMAPAAPLSPIHGGYGGENLKSYQNDFSSLRFNRTVCRYLFSKLSGRSNQTRSLPAPVQQQIPYVFKGFSMTQYAGDQVVRIETDEFKVVPKKFNMFNFKPFNEMVLKNPRIIT